MYLYKNSSVQKLVSVQNLEVESVQKLVSVQNLEVESVQNLVSVQNLEVQSVQNLIYGKLYKLDCKILSRTMNFFAVLFLVHGQIYLTLKS